MAEVGRPTEYKGDKTIKKVKDYLTLCVDEEYQRVKTEGDKSTSWDNLVKVKIPTIEGLAVYIGVSRDTIYQWKKDHDEFSDIIDILMAQQAERLLNNGLSGTYNSTIAKVLLTKHGYIEKSENDTTVHLPTPLLNGLRNNNGTPQNNSTE